MTTTSSSQISLSSSLRFHLLGAPTLESDGAPIVIERRKTVALLAYLALTQQTHLRDTIATLLWPESGQSLARANLRHSLTLLKEALGDDRLEIERGRIGLKLGALLWVDVLHFQTLVAGCQSHEHAPSDLCAKCLPLLLEAVEFRAEQFMAGFSLLDAPAFDDWHRSQQQQLTQALSDALDRLVGYFSKTGDSQAAIGYAQRRLQLDTLDEAAHRHLMQLYAWSGQQGLARRQFEQCSEILAQEMGISPSAATSQLMQEIQDGRAGINAEPVQEPVYQVAGKGQGATVEEGWRPAQPPRHNLPLRLPALIGRDLDLQAIGEMFERPEVNLVTLAGPGGVGKTQLSLSFASTLLEEFADGVYFISLAPLREADLVISVLAQNWNLQRQSNRPLLESVLHYLRHKRMLLILDNFEHVMAAAPLVSELLAHCAHLRVIVTSRELLHVQGEHLYTLSPLSLPKPEERTSPAAVAKAAAVQLFVKRAQAVSPSFMLDATNAADVADICTYLDGVPLALELVAARIRLLPPRALRQRLLGLNAASFELLQGGARDAPSRHRTLKDAISWSYELLTEAEQKLFCLLSVFAGGCTFESLEDVSTAAGGVDTGAILESLASLVNKSMVQQTMQPDGESRFSLLEMMREFGLEQLQANNESNAAARAHAESFATFVESALPALDGPGHLTWMARLNAEHDNCRAGLHWAITHRQADVAMRMAGALWSYWLDRGYYREGCQFLESVLQLPGAASHTPAHAKLLTGLSALNGVQGYLTEAHTSLKEALSIYREWGDERGLAMALEQFTELPHLANLRSQHEQCCVEALALYEKMNDVVRATRMHHAFGFIKYRDGEYSAAQAIFENVLSIYKVHRHEAKLGDALFFLGRALFQQQKFAEAEPCFAEALQRAQTRGDPALVAYVLYFQGRTAYYQGEIAKAEPLFEESLHIQREIGIFAALIAFPLAFLSDISLARVDTISAQRMLSEGLTLCYQKSDLFAISHILPRCAMLAATLGKRANVVQLTAAGHSLLRTIHASTPPNDQVVFERPLATARQWLTEEEFTLAWAAGERMTMAEAVALALTEIGSP